MAMAPSSFVLFVLFVVRSTLIDDFVVVVLIPKTCSESVHKLRQ